MTEFDDNGFQFSLEDKVLFEYPKSKKVVDPGSTLVMGDLHGNGLKLIHFLIEYSLLDMDEEGFYALVGAYQADDPFDEENKETLKSELARASFINLDQGISIIELGNKISDRGKSDAWTLLINQKMDVEGLNYTTVHSNHDEDGILAFETRFHRSLPDLSVAYEGRSFFCNHHSQSRVALWESVDNRQITEQEVFDLFENHYLPHLDLLTYRLKEDKSEIALFHHASINLGVVKGLADAFGVEYKDGTPVELAFTIDRLNQVYSEFKQANRIEALLPNNLFRKNLKGKIVSNAFSGDITPENFYKTFAILLLAWGQENLLDVEFLNKYSLVGVAPVPDYLVHHVHGHYGQPKSEPYKGVCDDGSRVICLNNWFGNGRNDHEPDQSPTACLDGRWLPPLLQQMRKYDKRFLERKLLDFGKLIQIYDFKRGGRHFFAGGPTVDAVNMQDVISDQTKDIYEKWAEIFRIGIEANLRENGKRSPETTLFYSYFETIKGLFMVLDLNSEIESYRAQNPELYFREPASIRADIRLSSISLLTNSRVNLKLADAELEEAFKEATNAVNQCQELLLNYQEKGSYQNLYEAFCIIFEHLNFERNNFLPEPPAVEVNNNFFIENFENVISTAEFSDEVRLSQIKLLHRILDLIKEEVTASAAYDAVVSLKAESQSSFLGRFF